MRAKAKEATERNVHTATTRLTDTSLLTEQSTNCLTVRSRKHTEPCTELLCWLISHFCLVNVYRKRQWSRSVPKVINVTRVALEWWFILCSSKDQIQACLSTIVGPYSLHHLQYGSQLQDCWLRLKNIRNTAKCLVPIWNNFLKWLYSLSFLKQKLLNY